MYRPARVFRIDQNTLPLVPDFDMHETYEDFIECHHNLPEYRNYTPEQMEKNCLTMDVKTFEEYEAAIFEQCANCDDPARAGDLLAFGALGVDYCVQYILLKDPDTNKLVISYLAYGDIALLPDGLWCGPGTEFPIDHWSYLDLPDSEHCRTFCGDVNVNIDLAKIPGFVFKEHSAVVGTFEDRGRTWTVRSNLDTRPYLNDYATLEYFETHVGYEHTNKTLQLNLERQELFIDGFPPHMPYGKKYEYPAPIYVPC